MKKQVILWATSAMLATVWVIACKNDSNTTPQTSQTIYLSATLNGKSVRPTPTTSAATGNLTGTIDPNSRVMTYTLTYSAGLVPTSAYLYRITNTVDSTGVADIALISGLTSGTITNPNPVTTTTPGSGTTTSPGSGTSTTPGSGTSTSPGNGTATTPGSGTSTTPGSGTTTTPGSGTSTTPGNGTTTTPGSGTSTGTGSTTITSPYSGTVTLTQSKIDSIRNGYYYISIGTSTYSSGEIRGRVRAQ